MTLFAAVCALQVLQYIFTPFHGYDIALYNPSPRAVIMTAIDVEFVAPAPTIILPAPAPQRISADTAVDVSIHGINDRRRDPNLADFKPECHDAEDGDST